VCGYFLDMCSSADAPPIWLIAADRGPRAALRAELIERGHDAIGFETLRDAVLTARLPHARPPALIVLDLQQQSLTAPLLDALFAIAPVIAIAGAADESLRPHPWSTWLRRPLTLGEVANAISSSLRPVAPSRL
jgi:hypothetical protein